MECSPQFNAILIPLDNKECFILALSSLQGIFAWFCGILCILLTLVLMYLISPVFYKLLFSQLPFDRNTNTYSKYTLTYKKSTRKCWWNWHLLVKKCKKNVSDYHEQTFSFMFVQKKPSTSIVQYTLQNLQTQTQLFLYKDGKFIWNIKTNKKAWKSIKIKE